MCETSFPEKEQVVLGLGEVIRAFRIARELSTSKLAKDVGIDRTCLDQIEAGKRSPTIDLLWRLAKGLMVPSSELVARMEERIVRENAVVGRLH